MYLKGIVILKDTYFYIAVIFTLIDGLNDTNSEIQK